MIDDRTTALILGTLPGEESLRQQRYYCHGRNDFWSLVFEAFGADVVLSYDKRLAFFLNHRVGLWDVLESADREGSSDSKIRNPVGNDFEILLTNYPGVRRVGLNGTKAAGLWGRHVAGRQKLPGQLSVVTLPSSSSTPGANVLPYAQKLVQWKRFLRG